VLCEYVHQVLAYATLPQTLVRPVHAADQATQLPQIIQSFAASMLPPFFASSYVISVSAKSLYIVSIQYILGRPLLLFPPVGVPAFSFTKDFTNYNE